MTDLPFPRGVGMYVLDDDAKPRRVQADDTLEWGQFMAYDQRRKIQLTTVNEECEVSTVFLGLDAQFSASQDAPPVLWETMVFGGPMHSANYRYTSREAAVEGHTKMLDKVRARIAEDQKSI